MDRDVISIIAFWSFGLFFTVLEVLRPARPIAYRKYFLNDFSAVIMYTIFFQMAVVITDRIPVPQYVPAAVLGLPLILKILIFLLWRTLVCIGCIVLCIPSIFGESINGIIRPPICIGLPVFGRRFLIAYFLIFPLFSHFLFCLRHRVSCSL